MPPIPPGLDWVGERVESIDRLVAAGPVLVHFFDFAQLNSIRTLPYLRAWHDRYEGEGMATIGVHSPRFPFTQDTAAVASAVERLGIDWPVAVDPEFILWRIYEPHGWPALFLWGRGGALRWYHLGEGDYAGTEKAIREALPEKNGGRESPPLLEPLRPSDVPDVKVIAPTPEVLPRRLDGGPVVEHGGRVLADARLPSGRRLRCNRRRRTDRDQRRRRVPRPHRSHPPRAAGADDARDDRTPHPGAGALPRPAPLLDPVRAGVARRRIKPTAAVGFC